MKKQIILIGILALVGMLAIFAGCAIEQAGSEEEAVVEITINQEMFTAKTIEPTNSMDITEYLLKWWRPAIEGEGAASTKTATPSGGTATVFLLLSPDSYNFKIEGYNASAELVGESAIFSTAVAPRKTLNIDLVIVPVVGTGGLDITVDWTALVPDTLNASLTADIYDFDADISTDIAIANFPSNPGVGEKIAVISGSGLADGYYKCVIKMKDDSDSSTLWATIDALRIVSDFTSIETYVLDHQFDSLINVDITENMQNPLDIDFFIADDTGSVYYNSTAPLPDFFQISQTTNLIVFAYPLDGAAKVSVGGFEWYLDGVAEISAAFGVEESLTPTPATFSQVVIPGGGLVGSYSLSVIVEKDGIISSRSIQLIVLP